MPLARMGPLTGTILAFRIAMGEGDCPRPRLPKAATTISRCFIRGYR